MSVSAPFNNEFGSRASLAAGSTRAKPQKITALIYAIIGFLFLGYCLYMYFAPFPVHERWDPEWRDIFDPFVFCTFPLFSVTCLLSALKLVRKKRPISAV